MSWNHPELMFALALGLAAAAFDLRTREIPNRLTLSVLVVAPLWHLTQGLLAHGPWVGLKSLGLSFLGILVCGVFPALSFARREMGGGDVKLFAALGALCGPRLGFDAQAFTFLLTLSIVLPWRLWQHRLFFTALRNVWLRVKNPLVVEASRSKITPFALPPVALAPWIFVGLTLAMWRNGVFV